MIAIANPNPRTTQPERTVPSAPWHDAGGGRAGHRVLVVPVAHLGAVVVLRLGDLVGVPGAAVLLLAPVRVQDAEQAAPLQRSADN